MIKKHYAQPTISVEELDMADIVCQSEGTGTHVTRYGGNAGFNYEGGSTISSGSDQRSKGRGIWDED